MLRVSLFVFIIFILINEIHSKNNRIDLFNICYDEYGCFTSLPPFGGTWHRPLALLPQSPNVVDTRFFLYTRENPSGIEIGRQKTNLGISTWNKERITRFVIHGMIENSNADWYNQMRKAFYDYEDINLIFVDWSKTNKFPYTQATANTQIVGSEVSLLINELITIHKADRMLIHIIGHSLGAHAAGYAGSKIKPSIYRITGLDPAGPLFEFTDPQVRLDSTDALFVDIIHTDGQDHLQLGLGLLQPIGHVDFYPNGGLEQPSCPKMSGKIFNSIINAFDAQGFADSVLCSHLFSVYLFIDSMINKNCSYISFKCNSIEKLKLNNECYQNERNQMGINASTLYQGTFYLTTQNANQLPFCHHIYLITLNIEKENIQTNGRIEFIFKGENFQISNIIFDKQSNFLLKSNNNITRSIQINESLNNLSSIKILMKYTFNGISQPISYIYIKDTQHDKNFKLCPMNNDSLQFEIC